MIVIFLLITSVISIDIIQLNNIHYDILMNETKYRPNTSCRGKGYIIDKEVKKMYRKVVNINDPYYGVYYYDSNYNLMKESIKQTNKISPNTSIILLTGDLAGHNLGTYSLTTTIEVVNEVRKKFNNVPIVFTIGNNEVVPGYYAKCNDHTYELYYKILSDKIPTS